MQPYHLRHPATLSRVTVHKPSSFRKLVVTSVLVVLFSIVTPWVYSTVGEPYTTALTELKSMRANASTTAHTQIIENQGVFETSFDEDEDDDNADEERKFGSRRAKLKVRKEHQKKKKDLKKKNGGDTTGTGTGASTPALQDVEIDRLPNSMLPSAVSSFVLFLLLSSTALFFLVQKWLVWFKVMVMYEEADKVTVDSVIHVEPLPHRGRPAIAPLSKSATGQLQFEFQRQKYEVFLQGAPEHDDGSAADGEEGAQKKESVGFADEESMTIIGEGKSNGTVRLIACPTTNSTESYVQSTGLSDKEVKSLEIKYGKNILAVEVRTFF